MIETLVCDCLNVTIHGDIKDANQDEVTYMRNMIDSISDQSRSEISQFVINSRLVRLDVDDIKERHTFLCLKRIIAKWQFTYCAVCGKETHAIPVTNGDAIDRTNSRLVLLSSHLLSDETQIRSLMSHAKYSHTFGIILPSGAPYQIPSGRAADFLIDQAVIRSLADVEMEVAEQVKQYLLLQRQQMEGRIQHFIDEENRVFEELCLTTQEQKSDFLRMVEAIKQQHELIADSESFDKENNSELTVEGINTKQDTFFLDDEATMYEISADYIRNQNVQSQQDISYSKQKMRSADFDGLFDIDDIDSDVNGKLLKEEPFDEDESEEQHDVFPVKGSNPYSSDAADVLDEVLPLQTQSGINIMSSEKIIRSRKMASSVVQNIPFNYQNKSRNVQTTPNSLPIQIPHIRSRMVDLDSDENQQKTGESIADRIQKLARSVRNETDMLDDRPRRRLNTGDLVKARPILN